MRLKWFVKAVMKVGWYESVCVADAYLHDSSSVLVPMALGVSRPNGAPPAGSILLCIARRPALRLPVPSLPGRPVALWTISSPHCVVATGASPAFGRGVFSHTGREPNSDVSRTLQSGFCTTGGSQMSQRKSNSCVWRDRTRPRGTGDPEACFAGARYDVFTHHRGKAP